VGPDPGPTYPGSRGQSARLTGVSIDTTERKQVEQGLENRLRFERLLSDFSARFINIKSMVARNQARPDDCVFCRISEDVMEDNIIQFEEMWRREEELERHLRSDEYHRVLLVLEMALKQSEIRFETISSSTGIETIEKARGTYMERPYKQKVPLADTRSARKEDNDD
jgi:hypothetical protein